MFEFKFILIPISAVYIKEGKTIYTRGGQTTAWGQKIARQGFFMCPQNFFFKLHSLNHIQESAKLDINVHNKRN